MPRRRRRECATDTFSAHEDLYHPVSTVADVTLMPEITSLHDSLHHITFVVVDVETTGFDPSHDRVLQVAAVVAAGDGTIVESFDTIVRPENPSEYVHGAEHVHGISSAQVADGMPLSGALDRLIELVAPHRFTAHNARFDLGFLRAESDRVGLQWSVPQHLDTLALARQSDPERQRPHSLSALCAHYGISRDREHEALADAQATVAVLFHLCRDLGINSVEQLDAVMSPESAPG